MKKFIIRKTWIVKAETPIDAFNIIKTRKCDNTVYKILSDEKGGKENQDGKKIKIEKVKKKSFRRW